MDHPQRNPLDMNIGLVHSVLVRFIRDEVRATGFRKAVLGLSGGVDSAVVAFLAAEALGKKNVTGMLMPHEKSSSESLKHGRAVVRALGIRSAETNITPIVSGYQKATGRSDKVRLGNAMARARMIVLYDRSAKERALVLGTSNKTELLLGYGTLHGDLASALNPIGDLYKTQLWRLAEHLGVPEAIIRKKPSADLWKGQSDEDELGFTYFEADRLLAAMIDDRRTDTELRVMGFTAAFIRKVRERIRKNQFKRRPPIIAKVSYRTINVDFRYPRDWGV